MFIIHSLEMLLSAAVWMKGRIQEFFLIFHYILVNNASILMKKRKIGGWHLGLHRGECVTVASYFLLFTISLVFLLIYILNDLHVSDGTNHLKFFQ